MKKAISEQASVMKYLRFPNTNLNFSQFKLFHSENTFMEYCVGIVFRATNQSKTHVDSVLMVLKNRPEWQAGCLNGIGGKVEAGETHLAAMAREMREETGLDVPEEKWNYFNEISGDDFKVSFFWVALEPEIYNSFKSLTDEQIITVPIDNIPENTVQGLESLVSEALALSSSSFQ